VSAIPQDKLQRADQWILWRLDQAIADADAALGPLRPTAPLTNKDAVKWTQEQRTQGMRLNDLAETARRFVWNELADWYVEAIKGRLAAGGDGAEVARAVLVHAFDGALRLLHPVVPFVTESIWQQLPSHKEETFLATAGWPRTERLGLEGARGAREFELVREAVGALRQIRAEYAVPSIEAFAIGPGDALGVFRDEADLFERLSRSSLRVVSSAPGGAAAHAVLAGGVSLVVPLAGLVDVEKECGRLRGELAALSALGSRLANEKFVSKAPPEVVEGERKKQAEWQARQTQLRDKVHSLCG
jgi:valyl-tRNA synthetase